MDDAHGVYIVNWRDRDRVHLSKTCASKREADDQARRIALVFNDSFLSGWRLSVAMLDGIYAGG